MSCSAVHRNNTVRKDAAMYLCNASLLLLGKSSPSEEEKIYIEPWGQVNHIHSLLYGLRPFFSLSSFSFFCGMKHFLNEILRLLWNCKTYVCILKQFYYWENFTFGSKFLCLISTPKTTTKRFALNFFFSQSDRELLYES